MSATIPYTVQEMQRIWDSVDRRIKKHGLKRLTMREINGEIHRYRREKGMLKRE